MVAGESESAAALALCTTLGGPYSSGGGPGGGTTGAAEAAAQGQGPGWLSADLPSAGDSLGLAIVSCNSERDLPHLSVAAGAIAEAPASAAAQAGGGSDAGAKCPPASASITLENAADILSLAGMVPADSNLFDNKVYQGIGHLADPLEKRWRDADRVSRFFQRNPRLVEGTFTVEVLSLQDGWVRGRPLADQARTQSTPLLAKFDKDDAITYLALAKRVLSAKGKLPKSYSAKRLVDVRELLQLEMRILHAYKVGCEQRPTAEGRCGGQGPGRLPTDLPSAGDSLGLAIVSCNSERDLPHLSVAAGAIAEAPASAAAQAGGGSDAGAKGPPASAVGGSGAAASSPAAAGVQSAAPTPKRCTFDSFWCCHCCLLFDSA